MKFSLALFSLVTSLFLLSCSKSSSTGETADTDAAPTDTLSIPGVEPATICMLDEVGVRETAGEKGKYLTAIYLGERVALTGDTTSELLGKKRNHYSRITMSDGKQGWVRTDFLGIDILPAAFLSDAPIHKRPDVSTMTDKNFKTMDFVAAKPAAGEWVEVRGKPVGASWFVTGYVHASTLTYQPIDAQFAALYQRGTNATKQELKEALFREAQDASVFGSSVFYNMMYVDEAEPEGDTDGDYFAPTVPFYMPDDGLAAYYSFSGNTEDARNPGNGGKEYGVKLTTDRADAENTAYEFDGRSFITLQWSVAHLTPPFSVGAWFDSNNEDPSQTLVSMGRSKDGTAFNFGTGEGTVYFGFIGATSPQGITFKLPASLDGWHFLTGTYDEKTVKLYLDGKLVGSQQMTEDDVIAIRNYFTNTAEPIEIGRELATLNRYFKGRIDDVFLYTRALSDEEVKKIFSGEGN